MSLVPYHILGEHADSACVQFHESRAHAPGEHIMLMLLTWLVVSQILLFHQMTVQRRRTAHLMRICDTLLLRFYHLERQTIEAETGFK